MEISTAVLLLLALVQLVMGQSVGWAIPYMEMEYCPLTPPQPCPEYKIYFILNRGVGPYTSTRGRDTKCGAVMPTDRVVIEWQKCEDPNLQWRWIKPDPSPGGQLMSPMDEEGYTHMEIRQLNATK
jgi:hypothetical protein